MTFDTLQQIQNFTEKPIVWKHYQWTVKEFFDMISDGTINIYPIGNRASTVAKDTNAKNVGIIKSIIKGLGINVITLRDIKSSVRLRDLYKEGVRYTVIDGGHRLRAIKWFIKNVFSIRAGKKNIKWKDLNESERNIIRNFIIPVSIVDCSSIQAKEIFETLNKSTQVKDYALIMVDEESKICEFVRQMTKTWSEYDTTCHKLFSVNNHIPSCFHTKVPNGGNIWDNFVFVIINKILGGGNVDAGENVSKNLILQEFNNGFILSKTVKNEVNKFFDYLFDLHIETGTKIKLDYFGCFQSIYFHIYEKSGGNFKFTDMESFSMAFNRAYTQLTSKKDKQTFKFEGELLKINKFVTSSSYAFAKSKYQNEVVKLFLKKMGTDYSEYGVTFLAKERSKSKKEKLQMLSETAGKCWVDFHYPGVCSQRGKKLNVDNVIAAHIVAHSRGGDECVGMCEHCNSEQGTLPLDEYKLILQKRHKKSNKLNDLAPLDKCLLPAIL